MKVLVVGSGAREHALVRALLRDSKVTAVVAAPGNAGIAAEVETFAVDVKDVAAVAALAGDLGVDLVVVGPEGPLVAGAADAVRARGIDCFGPSAAAAQIEGSKAFAKQVMADAGVPTAQAFVCTFRSEVENALTAFGAPYVVKDDGLAAGKGVVVTSDHAEALDHAMTCLAAGSQVVIEEFLDGPEVSLFAITDGTTVIPLVPAQDFKRVGDGDTGPNTGGMGAYAPLPWAPAGLVDEVMASVLQPTVDVMRERGTPFSGLLYAGLALTSRGVRVIEFNARFGDPETQVVLALLESPITDLLLGSVRGTLHGIDAPRWGGGAAVTVVVAAAGYPASPRTGDPITGISDADAMDGVSILHAGTRLSDSGEILSNGGRVLSVTAAGDSLSEARVRAYAALDCISLAGSHARRDIAAKAAGEI
jgi:phosphoribosylamine--glycine ligase